MIQCSLSAFPLNKLYLLGHSWRGEKGDMRFCSRGSLDSDDVTCGRLPICKIFPTSLIALLSIHSSDAFCLNSTVHENMRMSALYFNMLVNSASRAASAFSDGLPASSALRQCCAAHIRGGSRRPSPMWFRYNTPLKHYLIVVWAHI